MIASHCDWITLIQINNCNRRFRALIQDIVRKRLKMFLGPYFGVDNLPQFFNLLSKTNAVVVGGVIHAMLSSYSEPIYQTIKPKQLDMVVPHHQGHGFVAWTRFLITLNFNFLYDTASSNTYKHLSKRTVTMKRNVSCTLHKYTGTD